MGSTAWLLADFIDDIVLREAGAFTRRITGIVIAAEERGGHLMMSVSGASCLVRVCPGV